MPWFILLILETEHWFWSMTQAEKTVQKIISMMKLFSDVSMFAVIDVYFMNVFTVNQFAKFFFYNVSLYS